MNRTWYALFAAVIIALGSIIAFTLKQPLIGIILMTLTVVTLIICAIIALTAESKLTAPSQTELIAKSGSGAPALLIAFLIFLGLFGLIVWYVLGLIN